MRLPWEAEKAEQFNSVITEEVEMTELKHLRFHKNLIH